MSGSLESPAKSLKSWRARDDSNIRPLPSEGRGRAPREAPRVFLPSEISANLLYGLRPNFRDFSEYALINNANYLDFDSAILQVEL